MACAATAVILSSCATDEGWGNPTVHGRSMAPELTPLPPELDPEVQRREAARAERRRQRALAQNQPTPAQQTQSTTVAQQQPAPVAQTTVVAAPVVAEPTPAPAPVAKPAPQPVVKKTVTPKPAVSQVQPAPKAQAPTPTVKPVVQPVTKPVARPVFTPEQKKRHPVMPGQNRGQKLRD